MTKFKTVIILFFLSFKLFAQNDTLSDNFFIQANTGYGFIFEHRSSISYYVKGHVPEFKLRVGKSTIGTKQWQGLYKYPDLGFGYYFADLGNPDVLGNVNAVYFFIDVPYIRKKKINFSYNFELGLAYLSKKFDIQTNYFNTAISSHINAYINLGLLLDLKLSDKITWQNSINFTHYSNGKFASPNLGLNIINFQTGVKYYINNRKVPVKKEIAKQSDNKNIYYANLSTGLQQVTISDKNKYLCTSINFNYGRIINKKKIIGLGLDLFYNKGRNISLNKSIYSDIYDKSYNYRMGIHLSNDFVFNKFLFTAQVGYYLYSKYKTDEFIYNRFGIIYRFTKHFTTNITLKTHIIKADYVELGLGYYFLK